MTEAASPAYLEELSCEQRLVVEQRAPGQYLVKAAAGSGKTKTMAAVFAAAVEAGTPPDRILAVTFTDRAAQELRHRVAGCLGHRVAGESLDGAWIGTFHHLARRLLGDRAYSARVPRDLRLLDQVEAGSVLAAVAERVSAEDGWEELLPRSAPPARLLGMVRGAQLALAKLRSTDLESRTCREFSEAAYRASGDPEEELVWHRAALRLTTAIWEAYEEELAEQRAVDFDGLLRLALRCLRRSSLGAWCRRNFLTVVVDEYQDTSPLQDSLLGELVSPERCTLFKVGDGRQAIYSFRDAQPQIMENASGRAFPLFANYRSRDNILTAADHVIRQAQQFAADQPMTAARADAADGWPVWLGMAANPKAEADAIAEILSQVHRHGVLHPAGERQQVGWGEMAVLAATLNRLGPPLEEAFRQRGIPFQTVTGHLLDRPEVKDVLGWLRAADDSDGDQAWLRVLQSRLVRVADRELVALVPAEASGAATLEARLRRYLSGGAPAWRPQLVRRVVWAVAVIDGLRQGAGVRSGSQLLSQALRESGLLRLLEAEAVRAREGRRALAAVRELHRLSLELEARQRWLPLSELLRMLERLRQEGETAEPQLPGEEAVTVSTIHRAKGLEWPVVVVADCRPYQSRPSPQVVWDRSERAIIAHKASAVQDTRAFARWKSGHDSQVPREERRRLIYVAMTRARDLLLMTTTPTGLGVSQDLQALATADNPDLGKSEFGELAQRLAEGAPWIAAWPGFPGQPILPWAPVPGTHPEVAPAAPPTTATPTDLLRLRARIASVQSSAAAIAGSPLQLSFTALDVMESCPRHFWFRWVAGFDEEETAVVPGASPTAPAAMLLGQVVHRVLEEVHRDSPQGAPQARSVEEALERYGGVLGAEARARALEMLLGYLRMPVAQLPTLAVEFGFVWEHWSATPGVAPLVGSIDRLARDAEGRVWALDYKTDTQLEPPELLRYRRQLQLYGAALAAVLRGDRLPPLGLGLVRLRTGEFLSLDSAEDDLAAAVRWAEGLGRRTVVGDYSARNHASRPCPRCPQRPRCPERR